MGLFVQKFLVDRLCFLRYSVCGSEEVWSRGRVVVGFSVRKELI